MTRYIAPAAKAVHHAARLADWQRGQRPSPVTVEWDVSNVCSLGCGDCHFAHTHVAGPWAMTATRPDHYQQTGRFADVDMVSRALGEMADADVQAIVWSGGGEPTLHPAFAEITREAARLGLAQGLYTHGGHVTPELAAVLGETLTWAVVSLDAYQAETYADEKRVAARQFDAACEGIRHLASQPIVLGVSFLIHARNWGGALDMVQLARSLGATYTTLRPLIQTDMRDPGRPSVSLSWIDRAHGLLEAIGRQPDVEVDVDRFLAYRDWTGHGYPRCHGPALNTTVTPDGRVWICPQRRGLDGSSLGSLATESFADIWARHPGGWDVDRSCRVMCRLHPVNTAIAPVFHAPAHARFV